jgi:serine/threonine protein kinase
VASRLIADRYRLVDRIAVGGFGEVWQALDLELGITVALKRVRLDPGADEAGRARAAEAARAEARHAAALAFHPHIVAVTNVVVDEDGLPWLAMRHIPGRNLAEAVASGPLPPQETGRIAAALLSALEAAHQAGIVHRDVKPANVMLDDADGVFLTDFGIARRQEGTVTDAFVGSVGYAAPERFNHKAFGVPNGPAGDLFSLGATLYHAVEGRPPFEQDPDDSSVGTVLHAVCYEPHPRMQRAGHLAPLIDGLLAKQASERPGVEAARAMLEGRTAESVARTAESVARTVTADLPRPVRHDTVESRPDHQADSRPDRSPRRWPAAALALLALLTPVAYTLPAFKTVSHYTDSTNGSDDSQSTADFYRAVTAHGAPSWAKMVALLLVALLVLTMVAAGVMLSKGRAPKALRWGGYAAIPVAAVATVIGLQHSPWHVALLPRHTVDTWDTGSDTRTDSLDVGMWLLYAIFIGLYALFVWLDRRSRLTPAPTAAPPYAPRA